MIELTSDLDKLTSWVFALPVDGYHLGLSVRAANTLSNMGIRTIGDLVRCTPRRILVSRGKRKVLDEVVVVLAEMGLELAEDQP